MAYRLNDDILAFPHPSLADEDGLLAVGGDLSVERLLLAYQHGIFPWYNDDTPILWYSPHQRCVIYPNKVKVSNSMQQILRSKKFTVTVNHAFDQVIANCASIERKDQNGTWLNIDLQNAIKTLHKLGVALSVEVWSDNQLVGGLYGLQIGEVFCGESMFSTQSNASKIALIYLCRSMNFKLIDCQIRNEHLMSMGAEMIEQQVFSRLLNSKLI